MASTLTRYRRSMLEAEMEATVQGVVGKLGGYVFSIRDSRGHAVEHMPDLLIVTPAGAGRPGIIALIELKSQRRTITDGQLHVLELCALASEIVTGVVRPVPRPGEFSLDDLLSILTSERTHDDP